jgi:hypothetical protein
MTLNVNEIIEKKIQELENNHVIEDAIQKKIASVINDAVESAFNWEFTRAISDEIKKQIGNIAQNLKLNSYNTLIADTVGKLIDVELNKDLAEKVQTKFRNLMLVTEKSVKFSDIVKKFKEFCCDDDSEYSYEVRDSESESFGWKYKTFKFEPDNTDCEKLEITLSENQDVWTIFKVRYDGETNYCNDGVPVLKDYDPFECLVLKCLLNRLPIELDCSCSDCEGILYSYLD